MIRAALRHAAIATLAIGLASCAASPSSTVDVVVDAPSAPTATAAPPALCAATTEDAEARAFFRAYLGDAIVLKFSATFEDHADVASLLLANGATSAEPFITEDAILETDRLSVPIVASGADLRALEPYVRAGSLGAMGPTDVAIAETMALRLGIGRGSKVTLVRGAGPYRISRPRKARRGELRVAAILRFPAEAIHHYGDRTIFMTLDGLRAVGAADPSLDPTGRTAETTDETTGVRVVGDAELAPRWTELLKKLASPSTMYRVLTAAELSDRGYLLARSSAVALCDADARSGPIVVASPRPDTLRPCDDMGDLSVSKEVRASLFGQDYVVGPDAAAAETKAIARGAVRVDRGVVLSGAVATGAGIRFATVDAVGSARQEILAPYVVRGGLAKLSASRGIALSADLAAALGVDVGADVVIHATPEVSTDTTSHRAWRAPVVAIVRLPAEAVHRVGLEWVWADDAVVRSEWSLASDAFNVVRIQWSRPGDEVPLVAMMSDGIALQSAVSAPNRMDLELLELACPHSPPLPH